MGRRIFPILLVFLLSFAESASAISVSTSDGLFLGLSDNGLSAGVSINGAALPMIAAEGGFSFNELSNAENLPNLLLNSSFEEGGDSPANWSFLANNGNTPSWDNSFHSGAKSIKISVPGTNEAKSGQVRSGYIEAKPYQQYVFSAWGKTEGIGGSGTVAVRAGEYDANKRYLRQTNIHFKESTGDWTKKQAVFQTGENTSYIYVYANIWNGYGNFWIDDVRLSLIQPAYISGAAEKNGDGSITQRAQASGFDFTFKYIPKERYIEVQADVQNLRNDDRALQISYNLPVNAAGWNWWDYARGYRTINSSAPYKNTYLIGATRQQNVYPFSLIGNDSQGLALAALMDVPRIYRISYDTEAGYRIEYDFGLSDLTTKIGSGHANFTFIIYKADEPEWGFRSAAKKYYDIFPRFFEKRNEREGLVGWFHPMLESIENAADFGFAVDTAKNSYMWNTDRQRYNKPNGIYSFQIAFPWSWQRDFSTTNSTKPSYEERMAALEEDFTSGANKAWRDIVPLSLAAESVYNSAPYDKNGKMHLDTVPSFWNYWGMWKQEYPTNPDPEINPPNRFEISYKKYQLAITGKELAADWGFDARDTSLDSVTHHNGSNSAKIYVAGSENKISGSVSRYITVKPGTTYTFSAWGKTENTNGEGSIAVRIVELMPDGTKNYSTQRGAYFDYGTHDWTKKSVTFTTLDTTTRVFVYASIWKGYGTFWFDDVELMEDGGDTNLVSNSGLESKTNYAIDGVALDGLSIRSNPSLENYRREHWPYADSPLVFSYETGGLVLISAMSVYEFTDYLRGLLAIDGRMMLANILPNGYVFYAHLLDFLGSEINDVETDREASLRRTLSYKKTNYYTMTWHRDTYGNVEPISAEAVEKYLKSSTFYGVFPTISSAGGAIVDPSYPMGRTDLGYFDNPSLYNRDRSLFKKYIPIIKEISSAGWEPVPYAISDNPNIKLERYGYLDKSALHYALRNDEAAAQTGNITVDLTKLGFNGRGVFRIKELTTGASISYSLNSGKLIFGAAIDSLDTLVFSVSLADLDLNQDGSVDILDLRLVALHFGEATVSPYPRYDVNSDATVDILDLRLVAGGM